VGHEQVITSSILLSLSATSDPALAVVSAADCRASHYSLKRAIQIEMSRPAIIEVFGNGVAAAERQPSCTVAQRR
jgi:hypothetical protein